MGSPPNPNRALNAFLDPDGGDGPAFDDAAWLAAAQASPAWDEVSWLDGWQDARLVRSSSWSDVSWSDVSWSDVSWSDVSWSDVSWTDVSWSDSVYGDVAPELAQTLQQAQGPLVPRHAVRDARLAEPVAIREVPVVGLASACSFESRGR